MQTDDPRDAPKLVRVSPLRSSRSANLSSNSRAITSVKSPIYHNSFATTIDANRARLIEERRLGRERDIESVEKVIMRTTGIKIGAPKLRNISQIRETVFLDQSLTPIDKIGKLDSKNRPRSVVAGLEDGNVRISRTHNSLLADLRDLERLRNTPPTQRNHRGSSQKTELMVTISSKRNDAPTSAKIRSDIFKIQQMFQSADSSPRTVTKNSNDRKIRSDSEKEERKPGVEINRTRLLAQKLLEASRSNRELLKDRCNNPKNVSNKISSKNTNGKAFDKILYEIPEKDLRDNQKQKEDANSDYQPRPPVRRRRNSKNHQDWRDTDYIANGRRDVRDLDRGEDSSNGGASAEKNSNNRSNLERPDILDGLLRESDKQLANLKNDFGEKERSRSHWRGFVQSMRLHDVELHSDSEDQRKGEFTQILCISRVIKILIRKR